MWKERGKTRRLAGSITVPRLNHDTDGHFERLAMDQINNHAASEWGSHPSAFWRWLRYADPATAGRILAHAVTVCAERRVPPPSELVDALRLVLLPVRAPRGMPRKPEFAKAVQIKAERPDATAAEIAKDLGISHQTAGAWLKRPDFLALVERERTAAASTGLRPDRRFE